MLRLVVYGIIVLIFVLIINLLKYDNNFTGLSYDANISEVMTFVCTSILGGTYVGIYPISKLAKIIMILLSIIKFGLIYEIFIVEDKSPQNLDIWYAIENLVTVPGHLNK